MGNRPWQRSHSELLRLLQERLGVEFPELYLVERGEVVVVRGTYPLVDGGKVIDRYTIEIALPRTYPRGIPELREVGGRIPRHQDRHVEQDGRSCIFLPDEFCYRHPEGMDLIDFLNGPVLGFLVGQSLAEHGKAWPQGEHAHGEKGIIAFYGELVGSSDRQTVQDYLRVLAAEHLRGHWECPCGSGKRIRQCHWACLGELRARIPQAVARASLERMSQKVPQA